jgi:carboxyl-terminal processing protease
MNKKLNYTMPILFAIIVAFGMFIGARFANSYQLTGDADKNSRRKIDEVLAYINEMYVDKPDNEKLIEAAINAMLHELDPHSVYIPAKDLQVANEELEGEFEGIGVEFNILNDTIIVVTALSGGPSEQLGIRAGDRIIKIDNKNVAGVGFTNEDVFKNLRGPRGTQVKVSIKRQGESKLIDYAINRGKIPIHSVDASYMAAPGTGYIKISRFASTTTKEFEEAFKKLKEQGLNNLVIDLRGNPGGYLQTAFELADEFLDKGKMVVYTEGRTSKRQDYKASNIGSFESGKLVFLIDEGSASASEILSGAIQDWDRGLIIGRRSFGKGLVQDPIKLSDGSQIRLTVARYYTPSGRSIQKPYTAGYEEYETELIRRFEHGEQFSADSAKFADTAKYYTLVNKRLVKGGGGIMPDIFVGADTAENSDYLDKLLSKNSFLEFAVNYVDKNRASLSKRYPDLASFKKGFAVDEAMLESFVQYGERQGVKRDAKGLATSKGYIRNQLKALIARNIFHNEGYYQVVNEYNKAYQRAVQSFADGTFEKMKIK